MIDALCAASRCGRRAWWPCCGHPFVPGAMHIQPFGRAFPFRGRSRRAPPHRKSPPRRRLMHRAPPRAGQPSVSAIDSLKTRCARCRISIAVNALMIKFGSSARSSPQQVEIPLLLQGRMQSADHVDLGDPERQRVPHGATISSVASSKACASRFRAAKAQNWQESTQMFE